jgi:hypothetical protein
MEVFSFYSTMRKEPENGGGSRLVADIAREGTVWWCTHCGRIAADREGRMAALGWSKECTQNAVLVLENTMKLDESGRVIQAEMVDKPGESKFPRKIGDTGGGERSDKDQSGAN